MPWERAIKAWRVARRTAVKRIRSNSLSDPGDEDRSNEADRIPQLRLLRLTGLTTGDGDRDLFYAEAVLAGFDEQLGRAEPHFGEAQLVEHRTADGPKPVRAVGDLHLRDRVDQRCEHFDPRLAGDTVARAVGAYVPGSDDVVRSVLENRRDEIFELVDRVLPIGVHRHDHVRAILSGDLEPCLERAALSLVNWVFDDGRVG